METTTVGRFNWERSFRRAGKQSWRKGSTLAVGFYLASCADPDGGRIFPGVKNISTGLGLSESTVKRALAALRVHGWVRRVRESDYRKKLASEYQLTLPTGWVRSEGKGSPMTSHQTLPSGSSSIEDPLEREMYEMRENEERRKAESYARLEADLRAGGQSF